ncbi:MAG: ABC transporter permease [Burkholderiaceae bacterium]|nr:ABC transporter permease [Burkholderiaceae bacterium]MCO5104616.1 ABC transporter permease [Burkholderiaceae bacterium]
MNASMLDRLVGVPVLRAGHRLGMLTGTVLALSLLIGIAVGAAVWPDEGLRTQLDARSLPPGAGHWFGTDPLGRDVFTRTLKGLALSLQVGLASATLATLLAVCLGVVAAFHRRLDAAVGVLVDLVTAIPHLVLLVLLSFALGGGTRGVIIAVVLSHWPTLARVVRTEVRHVLAQDYIVVTRQLGASRLHIVSCHLLPHVLPQALVGGVLLFPHAVLHEAGLSFLGFGLEPHLPAIGILLSEAMRTLSAGYWWLGLWPGLCLMLMVLSFERVGSALRLMTDPRRAQE